MSGLSLVSPQSKPYGLAVGRGNMLVPVCPRCDANPDAQSDGVSTSTTYRHFMPLIDPSISAVLPVYANWYGDNSGGGDLDAPNAITIAAAVELDDGTVVPFTFAGQHTITIPASGGILAIPDFPLAIGKQVTRNDFWGTSRSGFYLRTYVSVSAGQKWPTFGIFSTADISNGSNGADATVLGSGAMTGSNANGYLPAAVLGSVKTRKPIVVTMGDSIINGANDQFNGPVTRACAQLGYGHVKLAKVGETALAMTTAAKRKYRGQLIPGCTHAVVEYGTNDGVTSGAKATSIQGYLQAIGDFLNSLGIKPILCTVPPKATSTNGFTTPGGQTPTNVPANLATLNSWIRGLPSPFVDYFDLHDLVASGRDTGLFASAPTARIVNDAATTSGSNVVTSASANFTAQDVGLGINIPGAITDASAIIGTVDSPTQVHVTRFGSAWNASATLSNTTANIGSYYATPDGTHPSTRFYDTLRDAMVTKLTGLSVS